MSILFWLGIYGSVLADMIVKYEAREVMLYSSAIMAGIMLWDVMMALLASSFRRFSFRASGGRILPKRLSLPLIVR